MKARLTHHAAPWLIALGLLASAPVHADRAVPSPSAHTQVPAQSATATPRLAWDRVGAPLQGMT
jgi:energy-converting hydrogenase Eha subunit F